MAEVAVDLADVTAGYGGSVAIESVTCRIAPGELVGIVGPSGSGKTTFLRAMTGRLGTYSGTVRVFGQEVRPGRPARDVGFVPQLGLRDPYFPLSVEQVVLLGLAPAIAGFPWASADERRASSALLERLGLEGLSNRPIGELSGGQLQRVMLARAMIGRRRLIVLDEPTSGVDLASRKDILRLLGELSDEGLTIVLTTHDLNWVAPQLPRLVCINRTVVADGPTVDVLTPEVLGATYETGISVVRSGGHVLIADAEEILHPHTNPTLPS